MSQLDESDLNPFDDADDDVVDNTKDPVRVDEDDDEGDDEGDDDVDPPAKSREAGVSPLVDSGDRDAAVPSSPPDAGGASKLDAGSAVAEASTPPATRDASTAPTVDASAPAVRDATTPSAPVDAATPPVVACRAGTFRGALSGEVVDGLARSRVTGTVTMVLGSTGTSLRVQTGTFEGKDAAGQTFRARLNAVLNCATSRLENGTLDEGVYNAREGLVSPIRFSGSIGGTLAAEPTVQGSWRWESALRSRSASGTFSATLQQ